MKVLISAVADTGSSLPAGRQVQSPLQRKLLRSEEFFYALHIGASSFYFCPFLNP